MLLHRLQTLTVITLLTLTPSVAIAQSTLKSSNFTLDGVNFGNFVALQTGTSVTPPEISTEGPTVIEVTPTTAIISWKTDKSSSSTVQFGATTSYGKEIGTSDLVTAHEVTLFGLEPETLYHYRVKSTDAFNGTTLSTDQTFTTPAEAGINSIKISDVTYDSALITWTTGLFSLSKVEYGTTTKYGLSESSESRSFKTGHTIKLAKLDPGTDYHYRIVAEDEEGNTTRSSDAIFTTIANPVFSAISVEPAINEAVVTWNTNTFTSGVITYQSEKDTKALTAGDSTLAGTHTTTLKNLFGQSAYTFSIKATDNQGKQVDSGPQSFSTLADTEKPTISDLKVSVTRSGEDLVLSVTWKSNEPATSKVTYAPKIDLESITDLPESSNLVSEHVVISTGLLPSTPYTLKAISKDSFGNATEETINFVSPGLRKSILQLILDNVLKSFGPFVKLFGE